ncbi:MAG: HDOD domain-containing protein, partial [Planctomycetota bacterium]
FITGVYPYYDKKNAYDIIMAISTQVPLESIYDLVPGIPSQLAAIMETATTFDIKSRYTCVEDMVTDLETYLENEAPEIKSAIEFTEIERSDCSDTLSSAVFNFTEMLKKDEPEVPDIEIAASVEGDIDALKMLVINKKHTQYTLFKRCADRLGLMCKSAQSTTDAEEIINNEHVDIAVISYEQKSTGTIKICNTARKKNIPFIMHGDTFSRKDILYAARLGSSAVMLNPIKEEPFIKKAREILSGAAAPPPEKQRGITTILFKGKNTPPEKARMVAKNVSNLLVLPHAAAKITSLCNDPDASADKLAVPIGSDSAIAAMVLRRANSVAFGGNRKITTIRDAVVRIGRRETRQLALTVAVYKLFDRKEKSFGFNRYMYWIHALGAAIAAKIISRKIKGLHEEDSFLGGLLHDLGKIIFDDHLNEEYQGVLKKSGADGMRMMMAEKEIFAMDHSFLGARVGENWKIPQHVTEAIEDHHKWERKKGTSILKIPAAAVTRIADSIIKAMGYVDDFKLDENDWRQILGSLVAIPRICREIHKELHEFAEFLGISTTESGLDERIRNKERKIRIVPEGVGVLLAFFFSARGCEVLFTSWKEFSYGEDDIACDARFMPANVYQGLLDPMAYWNRHIFVVGQDFEDAPVETVHSVKDATDFFQLEQVVNDIYSND